MSLDTFVLACSHIGHVISSFWFHFSIFYFLTVNLIYFGLLLASFGFIVNNLRQNPRLAGARRQLANVAPPISVIAPAYNEQLSIVQSVRSFLMLSYPNHEVIVVNDGSKDATLQKLIDAFDLKRLEKNVAPILTHKPVRGVYHCDAHPNLLVVDKENGGKADALNTGINYAKAELFCAVDADSILEEDALLKVAIPFIHDPENTVASGGTVRVVNGCEVKHGRVIRTGLPRNPLALIQVVEYLRAFLFGRVGWNFFNATLIISGAFGLFKRSAIVAAGGYQEGSLGEDMELVVRLHKSLGRSRKKRSIVFIPDPVCWTEVPSDIATLRRQRDRWQRGLAQTLLQNKDMLFNPRYGMLGMFTFPYYFFVELWGPVIEVVSYAWIFAGYWLGYLDVQSLVLFVIVGFLYGIMTSIAAVLIDEYSYSRYKSVSEIFLLVGITCIENLGYKQLNSLWRLMGLWNFFRGKKGWGAMARSGFVKPPTP